MHKIHHVIWATAKSHRFKIEFSSNNVRARQTERNNVYMQEIRSDWTRSKLNAITIKQTTEK